MVNTFACYFRFSGSCSADAFGRAGSNPVLDAYFSYFSSLFVPFPSLTELGAFLLACLDYIIWQVVWYPSYLHSVLDSDCREVVQSACLIGGGGERGGSG